MADYSTEYIQAVNTISFPHTDKERNKEREPRKAPSFSSWLKKNVGNSNMPGGVPMLSLEDEIMLARLRNIAAPVRRNPYEATAALPARPLIDGTDEEGQYAFEFMMAMGTIVQQNI